MMYDAVMRDKLISAGWIRPIGPESVQESGDIFPFALKDLTVDGELYGIPVFVCGNYLIYDRTDEAMAAVEHLTDLFPIYAQLEKLAGDERNHVILVR